MQLVIAAMHSSVPPPPCAQVAEYVSSLQQEDGSFFGDEWGEVDTRFSYCALSSMAILGLLDSGRIDVGKAAEFVGRPVTATVSFAREG